MLLKRVRKNYLIISLCTIFIIYFIIYPKLCINSTISGVSIFFVSVFPSLFIFLIICNILVSYDGITVYSKLLGKYICVPMKLPNQCSFALIVSAICGYPLGAKYTCELYEKKLITKEQCERLLNIASNASPLFVVGAVGTVMMKSVQMGYIFLISNYISCILMGIILGHKKHLSHRQEINTEYSNMSKVNNFGEALKDSIDNAIKTSLSIGAYITLFSVIIDIIKNNAIINIVFEFLQQSFINKDKIKIFLFGLIELTQGCYYVSNSNFDLIFKVSIINFFIGFSGLAIISQVYSFVSKYSEIKISKYISRKFIQGILSGLSAAIITLILSENGKLQPVFQNINTDNNNNKVILLLIISIIILLPIIFHTVVKSSHIS